MEPAPAQPVEIQISQPLHRHVGPYSPFSWRLLPLETVPPSRRQRGSPLCRMLARCAPLKLLVEEAGGRFTDLAGAATIYSGHAVASNGLLHDAVLDLMGA